MRNTKEAFFWILDLLKSSEISFQISGGLAAKIYGSNRPLADIDIDVSDKDLVKLSRIINSEHIIFGPRRYKDSEFDLLLMTLRYQDQEIDICGIDSQRLFDKKKKIWTEESIDLFKAVPKEVFGRRIPVIPLNDLLDYKKRIRRDVDLIDVTNLISKK